MSLERSVLGGTGLVRGTKTSSSTIPLTRVIRDTDRETL